jgi:hypothetical protein
MPPALLHEIAALSAQDIDERQEGTEQNRAIVTDQLHQTGLLDQAAALNEVMGAFTSRGRWTG